MAELRYPHKVTICMSDGLVEKLRREMQTKFAADRSGRESDGVLLHVLRCIGKDEGMPIFLRTNAEAAAEAAKGAD